MSDKNHKTKSIGETDFDDIIDSFGVKFSDKEIDALNTLRRSMQDSKGLQRFFDGLFTMYRVKSNEKLSKSTRFNSWAMFTITAGLLFVGIVGLLIN